jgi:hypothetical protein
LAVNFRELNELRKPSTDNPEILRFFRYMKAAKDGQDGVDCIQLHPGCSSSSAPTSVQPPMIKTYHDINKLVQARRLGKSIGVETKTNHSPEVKWVMLHVKRASVTTEMCLWFSDL